MDENILDRDLNDDLYHSNRQRHFQKWAKRWSWISVIILFVFVFMSGVLIPIFDSRTETAVEFIGLTGLMIIIFLSLLTISNLLSLFYRWRGFNLLVQRRERDYFNLITALLFLVAPFVLILLFSGIFV